MEGYERDDGKAKQRKIKKKREKKQHARRIEGMRATSAMTAPRCTWMPDSSLLLPLPTACRFFFLKQKSAWLMRKGKKIKNEPAERKYAGR